jgi:hypothetical protein
MPTRSTSIPHARRYRPLLLLTAGLLLMLAVGSGILLAGTSTAPCKDAAATEESAAALSREDASRTPVTGARMTRLVTAAPHAASFGDDDEDVAPTGVDLQVRVWTLRIEFPWLKSLPVRPGRQIVVSIFAAARSY